MGRICLLLLITAALLCHVSYCTITRVQKLGAANNEFTLQMYKKFLETMDDSGKGNLFYGPLSIYTAMAMVYLGTAGDTKTQLEQVMRFENIGQNFHESFQDLNAILFEGEKNFTLKSANKLFPDAKFNDKIKQQFKDATEMYYKAGVETKDYQRAAETSRQEINQWVEDQTEDKIKDLMPDGTIDASTVLVLVNAMYFKGKWKNTFDENQTKPMKFYTSDNDADSIMMDFMYKKAKFPLHIDTERHVKVLELPYSGDALSMYIILPDARAGLKQTESDLDLETLNILLDDSKFDARQDVMVWLPKFKIAQTFDLIKTFQDLGMLDLFEAGKADLSGIAADVPLYVSAIQHQAYVEVNEEGTEAAAATGVGISRTSLPLNPPPEFKADHPFMFLIKEKASGTILFMGRVMDQPSESAQFQRSHDDDDDDHDDDDDDDTTNAAAATTMSFFVFACHLLLVLVNRHE